MFQLGLINSIFWCVGLACAIIMILLAIKGKKPFLTILSVLFGVVFIFNLSLAVDAKWISLVFNSSAKDWTKTHDYIFYSLVLVDVLCAICLLFAKSNKINDKLWKCFAIINIVTTIACNVYNYYTGIVNYKFIQPLTNDVPALLETISNVILYARFILTFGFGVGLLFAKVKAKPQEEVAPETVRPELELITEVDVKPATELATATDTQEQETTEETLEQQPEITTEDVVEETLDEQQEVELIDQQEEITEEPHTQEEVVEQEVIVQPTEEAVEEEIIEEVIEETVEQQEVELVDQQEEITEEPHAQEEVVEQEVIVQPTEEAVEEEIIEEVIEETVEEQQEVELIDQQEEITEEPQQEVIVQPTEETLEQQEVVKQETNEQQQKIDQSTTVVTPAIAKDKPKKKLSKSKRRVRPTKKFINYIRHSKVEIQIPNMICKNCGTKTHSESKICPRCFHKMVPLYKCPQCDTLNETRVCSNCGTKIGKK